MDGRTTSLEVLPEEKLVDFSILAEYAPVMLWLPNSDGDNIFSNSLHKTFISHENVEKLGVKAWFDALQPDDQKNLSSNVLSRLSNT